MEKRHFLIDKYHTWYDWGLVLTDKSAPDPEPKTYYMALDGVDGDLDMTEVLTGEVAYNSRTVTASFSASNGTYKEREALLREITAAVHGRKVKLVDPDDTERYFLGRVKVVPGVRHVSYHTFILEAICDPYRYAMEESSRRVEVANGSAKEVVLLNLGRKTLCPEITVDGTVTLTFSGATAELTTGTYKVADIKLRTGATVVRVAGNGVVTFTYREAWL